jgi:hypothetical protein
LSLNHGRHRKSGRAMRANMPAPAAASHQNV